jgi:hypothetical protein
MNKHEMDVVSLTFGSVFLGIVVMWLFSRLVTFDLPRFGWFVASVLILLGLAGVAVNMGRAAKTAKIDR